MTGNYLLVSVSRFVVVLKMNGEIVTLNISEKKVVGNKPVKEIKFRL